VPQIEVTFNIDANGILNVTAKDKGSGKEQSITISGSGNLDKADVEKMAKEAEANADEDKKKREAVEARNLLDNSIYQAEKMARDYKEKLSEEDLKTLTNAVEDAKKVAGDDKADKDALEAAAKDLNDKLMPIGSKMYEQAEKAEAADEDAKDDKSEKSDKDKKDTVEGEVVDEK